jgi:hypothetical protein
LTDAPLARAEMGTGADLATGVLIGLADAGVDAVNLALVPACNAVCEVITS